MPTVEFDIGNIVICDLCDKDYTHSNACCGFLFQSKGVCPDCAPRFLASVRRYGEMSKHGPDTKIASGRITIEAETHIPEMVEKTVAWIMSKLDSAKAETNTGYRSAATNTGDRMAADYKDHLGIEK